MTAWRGKRRERKSGSTREDPDSRTLNRRRPNKKQTRNTQPKCDIAMCNMVGNLLRRAFVNLMRQRSSMPSVSLRLRVCFIRSSCSYVLTLFHHRNEGSAVPILTSLRAFALSSFTEPSDSHAPTNSRRRRPSLGWRFCCSHQLVFAGVARMGRMWPHVTC